MWTAVIPPSALLAVIPHNERAGELVCEYVVDLTDEIEVFEMDASSDPAGQSVKVRIRASSRKQAKRRVRELVEDAGLDGLRISAFGWSVDAHHGDRAEVSFRGATEVLGALGDYLAVKGNRWMV